MLGISLNGGGGALPAALLDYAQRTAHGRGGMTDPSINVTSQKTQGEEPPKVTGVPFSMRGSRAGLWHKGHDVG